MEAATAAAINPEITAAFAAPDAPKVNTESGVAIAIAVASAVFAVPVDEKAEVIRECLPGANCGACGYAGCDEYAKAVASGEAATNLCIPGADAVAAEVAGIMAITKAAALAYLMFNLFTPPCFAAIGAMNAELKSKKWLFGAIALQLSVGYTVAFLTYFFGTLIVGGNFGAYWMPIVGWSVIVAIAAVMAVLIVKKNKELKVENA